MLTNVKVDGLLFYHVYSDLTTLVKSRKLDKSLLDMNVHYLELLNFLQELKLHSACIMNRSKPVFVSESRYMDREKKRYIM